ncbi:AraC family transcriptional regulator [Streptomyces sp. NPDC048057]|uniref:AraC family transcriptional regulator n=1 Tax=Streptomyces sp. NPDC048057 TaxID=3155628 RepID=UPI0033CE13CD
MLDRLNEAMERIEERLAGTVDAAELAAVAMTSEHHFRRLFSALAGMPLSEYVRRRRLTVAGAEVVTGRRTLLDIATDHGYGSGESFARAFRAFHGVGPGEARRTGAALCSQSRLSFRLTVEGSSTMRYRVVEKGAFAVVGKKTRAPLVHVGVNPALATFVRGIDRGVLDRIAELGDQEPAGVVGVTDDLDPSRAEGTAFTYYHGVVTSASPPDDLDRLTVPAGTWAVFAYSGAFPEALQYLWRDVFTQWFPANPYRTRPGPELLRVELSDDGRQAEAELWVPVEADGAGVRGW